MDDVLLLDVVQSIKNLDGKTSDQTERETLEVTCFQEIIKVDRQQFECNTQMVPKLDHFLHSYDVVLIIRIMVSEVSKNLDFHLCLILELLAVLDDL